MELRLSRVLRGYPRVAAGFAIAVGVIALLWWVAALCGWMRTPAIHGLTLMVPNAAVKAMLSGVGAWLAWSPRRGRAARAISRSAAILVLALSLAALFEHVSNIDLGIDRWFPYRSMVAVTPIHRPGLPGSVVYSIFALALLAGDRRIRAGWYWSEILAQAVAAFALVGLLGYAFGVPEMYGVSELHAHIGMSVPSAIVTLALAVGLFAGRAADDGMAAILLARDAGGMIARRLLVGLGIFPLIAIGIVLGARFDQYSLPVASALVVFFAIAEATGFVFSIARRVSHIDQRQRRVTDELRVSEARLRMLFDQAQDAILIGNANGIAIEANPAFAAMFGYTLLEVPGMPFTQLLDLRECERFEREREDIVAGKPTRNEWQVLRRDGSTFVTEVCSALLSDGRWQAIIRDTTERNAQREFLNSIVEQLPYGVVVVDEHEQIVVLNHAVRAYAREPSRPNQDAWANSAMFEIRDARGALIPFEELPLVRSLRSGRPVPSAEYQLVCSDGSTVHIEASPALLRDDRGTPTGALIIMHDITERRELERLRDEWTAVIAHDLRQPLSALLVSVDLLREANPALPPAAVLGGMRRATLRLTRMVDDLLDDARISAHQLTVQLARVDLAAIARHAIEQAKLANRGVTFELAAPVELFAQVDPDRIEQVLGNLLSNAIKYRDPDTSIYVEVAATAEAARVSVVNRSPPIEPDEIGRLFSRFRRTRAAKRGKQPGLGIGLYISKGLVEAHGGTITCESRDGWTKLTFSVPVERNGRPRLNASSSAPARS